MISKQHQARSLRQLHQRQHALRKRFFRLLPRGFERLEDRSLLANVTWDGGGGNFDWGNASNWSADTLPLSGDDVIIPDLSGTPTITSGGTVGINSLAATEALAITGGSFTVAQTSQLNAGLNLSSGTLTANGAVMMGGTSTWSGGTISGSGSVTIGSSASLTLNSAGNLNSNVSMTNQGTMTLLSGIFNEGSGKTFTNSGTFNVQNSGTVFNSSGTIVNTGTFQKTVDAGLAIINNPFNNTGGTISVLAGTLALSGGGTHAGGTFDVSGAAIQLSGSIAATGSFTGSFAGSGAVQVTGGTYTIGAAGANWNFPTGRMVWTNGNLSSSGGGTLTIASGSGLTVNAGTVTVSANVSNQGTLAMVAGVFNVQSGFSLNNAGVLDVQTTGTLFNSTGTINNTGTFKKTTSAAGATVGNPFSNSGTVQVDAGTLTFSSVSSISSNTLNSGTWTVGASSTLGLPSTVNAIGAAAAVSLTGSGASIPNLTSNLNTNIGSFTVTGGATFTRAASFTNRGTLTIGSSSTVTTNTMSMDSSTGTVTVAAGGTLTIAGTTNTYTATSGTTTVNGTLSNANTSASAVVINAGGFLGGTGNVQANLTVNGIINPGTVGIPGNLTVSGNYTQGGALELELISATQFDVLTVTGSATLTGGSMLRTRLSGYTPTAGDSLQVLSFGSRSGDFGTKSLEGVSGLFFNPVYGGTALTLTATATTAVAWSGAGDGATWNSTLNWVGGVIPNGSQYDVSIPDVPATTQINIAAPTAVNSVSAAERIVVSSGTFTVNASGLSSAFNGGLSLSSGTIHIMSDASAANVVMSGGTLDVETGATFNLSGSSTWSGSQLGSGTLAGGQVRNTGTLTINIAGGVNVLVGTSFSNSGTVLHTGGTVNSAGGRITNEVPGLWDIQSSTGGLTSNGGTTGGVVNLGTMQRTSGTGAFSFNASVVGTPSFQNSGLLDIQSGTATMTGAEAVTNTGEYRVASGSTLTLSNGAHAFGVGTSFTGAGIVEFAGASPGYTFAADVTAGDVRVTGSGINVANGKTFTWTGANSTWTAGDIAGAGKIVNTRTVGLTGGSLSGTFQNQGTVNWTAGNVTGGGTFVNQSTFNDQTTATVSFGAAFTNQALATYTHSGAGTATYTGVFTNSSAVNVTAGKLSLDASGAVTHSGNFDGSGSGILEIGRGTHTVNGNVTTPNVRFFNAGTTTFNGVYNVSGSTTGSDNTNNVTFSSTSTVTSIGSSLTLGTFGTYTFNSGETIATGNISVAGATLTGSDNINLNSGGTFAWTAGTLSGTGSTTLGASSETTLSTTGSKTLSRASSNLGTVNWTGGSVTGTGTLIN